MNNRQIKENLYDMSVLSQSKTPEAALNRIMELEGVLYRLAYWFDTDQEILDAMSKDELAGHLRLQKMINEVLS